MKFAAFMAFPFIIFFHVLSVLFSSSCVCLYVLFTFNSVSYVFLLLHMFCSEYSVFIVPTDILLLLCLTGVFPCFFLSCKANARVYLAKTVHGPPSFQFIVLFCALFVSIVLFYVLFVCKCVLYYCHRVSTQLQLTNISYINYSRTYMSTKSKYWCT
jgi:hypothetical protein